MGQNDSISAIDEELKNFLWRVIEGNSGLKTSISRREQIVFSSPKTLKKSSMGISVFLLNMSTGQGRAKELSYLVTPFTGSESEDHLFLEIIARQISDSQYLEPVEGEASRRLAVRMKSVSLKELTDLWMALGTPLRPSICMMVKTTEENSPAIHTMSETTPALQNAVPLYQAVFKTFTEQSDGWERRNLFVRQWVIQDFRKVTELTPSEMLALLNRLGDKLAHDESTLDCVKPLRRLAVYYEHQLNELSGMQKVSRNQRENIELVSGWIKDVNALIEAINPEHVSGKEHKPT